MTRIVGLCQDLQILLIYALSLSLKQVCFSTLSSEEGCRQLRWGKQQTKRLDMLLTTWHRRRFSRRAAKRMYAKWSKYQNMSKETPNVQHLSNINYQNIIQKTQTISKIIKIHSFQQKQLIFSQNNPATAQFGDLATFRPGSFASTERSQGRLIRSGNQDGTSDVGLALGWSQRSLGSRTLAVFGGACHKNSGRCLLCSLC